MKKVVVTQAFGDKWMEVLALTKPRMEDYCKRTQNDFISIEKPLVEPVQYTKLVIANIMVTRGYEQVTFFDCDVLIAQDCEDIAAQGDDYAFLGFNEGEYLDRKKGLKDLAKTFGAEIEPKFYFNTGVFALNKGAIGALSQPPMGLFPNHFAEQTWLNLNLHLWGTKAQDLDPAYNCMTSVESHFGLDRYRDAMVIHYAGQSNDMIQLKTSIQYDDAKLKGMGR